MMNQAETKKKQKHGPYESSKKADVQFVLFLCVCVCVKWCVVLAAHTFEWSAREENKEKRETKQ